MKKISLEELGLDGLRPRATPSKPKKLPTKTTIYIPTEEAAAKVESLASFGVSHGDIAKYLKISTQTLEKYYGDILLAASLDKNEKVAKTLYEKALTGDNQSMIFWMKARAGWQEKTQVEITTNISITQALEQAQARLDSYIDGEAEQI